MPELIEVKSRHLNALLDDIDKGLLRIPRFQREVVWELKDSVLLLDSIYRGFPIGSLVIWETGEHLPDVRAIGDLDLPAPPGNQIPSYILDGQQRLTSIYACAREAKVRSKKRKSPVNYIAWFDLDRKCFTTDRPVNGVTFKQLIATNYDEYRDPLTAPHRKVFTESRKILLEDYRFSTIVIRDRKLEEACVIFERINNSGKKLTIFDLLVAKVYPLNFDLRKEWKQLDRNLKTFRGMNPILPMQALSLLTVKLQDGKAGDRYGCHKRHLLAIQPELIKGRWTDIKDGVRLAVDFLVNHVGVPTIKLVPYEAPIALYTLFFLLNSKYGPNEKQARQLAEYFWCSCASSRYGGSPESSMEEDAQSIRAIQQGTLTGKWVWARPLTAAMILGTRYDRRDALVQTILCHLASRQPRSFKSNTPIPIAKEFSKFNATDFHHIFPQGWLKLTRHREWIAQEHSLANICLSPAREQRHEIKADPARQISGGFSEVEQPVGRGAGKSSYGRRVGAPAAAERFRGLHPPAGGTYRRSDQSGRHYPGAGDEARLNREPISYRRRVRRRMTPSLQAYQPKPVPRSKARRRDRISSARSARAASVSSGGIKR